MPIHSPVLTVMLEVVEKVSARLKRDFMELENLQSSAQSAERFAVTAYQKVEEMLVHQLIKAHPRSNVILPSGKTIVNDNQAEYIWIVNPIDGLYNFSRALPQFCTAIALRKKQQIEAAVILSPIYDDTYFAEKAGGAFVNNRRLRVSSRESLTTSIIAFDHYQRDTVYSEVTNKLITQTNTRYSGSSLIDLVYVASGRYDACFVFDRDPCGSEAGMLLVQQAGGYAIKLPESKDDFILATNNQLYKELLKLCNEKYHI